MSQEFTIDSALIEKYNVPGPRYTSYPTVPFWDNATFSKIKWENCVKQIFESTNSTEGISLYIHLPYCESLCTYCGCNTRITVNHEVEIPYIQTIIKEWSLYKTVLGSAPLIKEIHLGGGTPTFFKPENLELLILGIMDSVLLDKESEFSFEGHPVNTTKEHLRVLNKLGFKRVSFGIQDFNKKVQTVINRFQSEEDVLNATQWARELGYKSVNYDLVYGLPFQNIETITNTIEKVIQLKPDRIAFYSYAHVPWIKPGQRMFTELDLPTGKEKRELYELGRKILEVNGYFEIGMDHFALKEDSLYKAMVERKLHRNFMGYTTNKNSLMIGLGVSSISDTTTAFAQNEKTVERYVEKITNGDLAVFRGHILTKEDQVLRRHILNIICTYETDWSNSGEQGDVLMESIESLEEFIQDGLIELSGCHLRVLEKGYPFVRNICMAFDKRLRDKSDSYQLFSSTV